MKAVFADTFYWAALTSTDDAYHSRAIQYSRSLHPEKLITTDDVLDEYLAFFADARQSIRIQAGNIVSELLENPGILVIPQSRELFLSASNSTVPGPTRVIA